MARPVPASGVLEPNEIYDTNEVYDPATALYFNDLWVRGAAAGAAMCCVP